MPPAPDGGNGGRLSPLFTWRSAVASGGGPGDFAIPVVRAGEQTDTIVKAATQRHVALTLSIHMNERGGSCYPGVPRIAAESSLGERGVQRALRALALTGWLHVSVAGAPDGTNLYQATIPDSYVHDEGAYPVHQAYSVRRTGVSGTGKGVNQDVTSSPPENSPRALVEEVVVSWRDHAPPLISHRDSYLADTKTVRAIRRALKTFDASSIATAITNYATVLAGDDYRWDHSWTIRDFLQRGLDRFVDEAKPLENFRRRERRPGSSENYDDIEDL